VEQHNEEHSETDEENEEHDQAVEKPGPPRRGCGGDQGGGAGWGREITWDSLRRAGCPGRSDGSVSSTMRSTARPTKKRRGTTRPRRRRGWGTRRGRGRGWENTWDSLRRASVEGGHAT